MLDRLDTLSVDGLRVRRRFDGDRAAAVAVPGHVLIIDSLGWPYSELCKARSITDRRILYHPSRSAYAAG